MQIEYRLKDWQQMKDSDKILLDFYGKLTSPLVWLTRQGVHSFDHNIIKLSSHALEMMKNWLINLDYPYGQKNKATSTRNF